MEPSTKKRSTSDHGHGTVTFSTKLPETCKPRPSASARCGHRHVTSMRVVPGRGDGGAEESSQPEHDAEAGEGRLERWREALVDEVELVAIPEGESAGQTMLEVAAERAPDRNVVHAQEEEDDEGEDKERVLGSLGAALA
eukprot:3341175-Rhodomonas_salina.3